MRFVLCVHPVGKSQLCTQVGRNGKTFFLLKYSAKKDTCSLKAWAAVTGGKDWSWDVARQVLGGRTKKYSSTMKKSNLGLKNGRSLFPPFGKIEPLLPAVTT